MKNILILFMIFSILFSGCVRKEMNPIDNEFFLIGTLSDYMGREMNGRVENRVDKYYHSEKRLCLAIDSILKQSYPDLELSSYQHNATNIDEFELHSIKLAGRVTEYYNLKYSGRGTLKAGVDHKSLSLDTMRSTKDFYATYYDTIYTGSLKPEVFETEKQKISFITGAYIRFGAFNDSLSFICVPNSVSKISVLDKLLREIGCTNVQYEILKGDIPVGHCVYFKPTRKLQGYFEQYITLR